MPQNLVNSSLEDATVDSITSAIDGFYTQLPFLVSVSSDDKGSLLKLGPNYTPFADNIDTLVKDYPKILSGIFDKEGYFADRALYPKVEKLHAKVGAFFKALDDTKTALGSDIMVASIDAYTSAVQNKDKVPGLSTLVSKLQEFFKKRRTSIPPVVNK